jgi:two-component system osmolarity sensor histidine kinase EnvZ
MPLRLFGSLFWRTFALIGVLLALSLAAWYLVVRQSDNAPRALQAAQQLQTMINLTRAALVHSDAPRRTALLAELQEREGIQVFPRHASDQVLPLAGDRFNELLQTEVRALLGRGTTYASSVNGREGLWVSFDIGQQDYWLLAPAERFERPLGVGWLVWGAAALALSLLGAIAITRLINRPLKQISYAASRIREGDFSQELTEQSGTEEIRALNAGFNRMARTLEKVDAERGIMLAGISHDLRTPLTRLRLEIELSVQDPLARENMIREIEAVDAIINKFLDYARPSTAQLEPVAIKPLMEDIVANYRNDDNVRLFGKKIPECSVLAERTELRRALVNIIENARRYGRSANSQRAEVEVSVRLADERVAIELRDRGPGVRPEDIPNLTRPFYRGDAARTQVKGTGLGLAIVDKVVEHMGGRLRIANAEGGGLSVRIELRRAPGT